MTNKNYKTRASRDGITLLFVISMVVLFLLMGTTFMLVSNDYYKSARTRAEVMSYQVDPTALLDRCFYDLVRGPALADVNSPLRGHSILADQYGYGITAEVFAAPGSLIPETLSGPFVTISLSAAPTAPALSAMPDPMNLVRNPMVNLDLSNDAVMMSATGSTYVDNLYAGRVFSITSGALRGFSSRIISHTFVPDTSATPDPSNNRMTVVVLASGLDWTALENNDRVVINGADFSGRGAGDLTNFSAGGSLDGLENYDPDAVVSGGLGSNSSQVNQQGAVFAPAGMPSSGNGTADAINEDLEGYLASDQSTNEPYDIPDHQNLFLSAILARDAMGNPTQIIPSFHRDTILQSQIGGSASASVWRQHSLRPVFIRDPAGATVPGMPGFPPEPAVGSSANYEFFERTLPELVTDIDTDGPIGANGTFNGSFMRNVPANLDVDSDGDGNLDSVWIDIGLPAQTDSEGRTFKPLVAYRVVDMDGKINLNTSGMFADQLAGAPTPPSLRGGSYGVAEISPRDFVTDYTGLLNSRYQSPEFADLAMPPTPIPGAEADASGNVLTTTSSLDRNQKLFGYPPGIHDSTDVTRMLGGSFATGLDLFGQLQLESLSLTTLPEFQIPTTPPLTSAVSPYQVNFGLAGSSLDSLFTAVELEGLLRAGDADGQLQPTRLRDLVLPAKRNNVTTHSFEITLPATTGSLVRKLNNLLADPGGAAVATPAARTALINGLLSQHVLLGGKIDINRALGNGIDDNDDGVVDNESLLPTPVEEPTDQFGTTSPVADLDQDGMQEMGDAAARQILAQDLYIMALLACGDTAPPGLALTSGTGAVADAAYRRMIAQWAVNVVDFRDPDSVMTGFEVDLAPFDTGGWEVDGDLTTDGAVDAAGTNRTVVWGAERPELLITETFAYHDRRNEDLPMDNGDNDDLAGDDDDWDSRQVPQSGAFFELYHPWGEADEITRLTPEELGSGGVDLGQETPEGDPVWRLAFKRSRADAMFTRAVYFYEVDTTLPSLMDGVAGDFFFSTLGSKIVAPGEHAVIGSSGNVGERPADSDRYETTFGRRSAPVAPGPVATDADLDLTRAIILDIEDDLVVRRDGMGMEAPGVSAKTIAIDSPRSLSISDPSGGYTAALTAANARTAGSGDGQQLMRALDRPLDAGAAAEDIDAIWTNGVTDNFRFVYLQRLANPLLPWNPEAGVAGHDSTRAVNPYLTIDTAGVDLLAFNGMETNTDNGATAEVYLDGGVAKAVIDGGTDFKSVERGESKIADGAEVPRQNLFTSEEGNQIDPGTDAAIVASDGHNLSYAFTETFGSFNSSYTAGTGPLGWLTWNNRPYANAQEIANVPFYSSEWLCYYFNRGTIDGEGTMAVTDADVKPIGVLVGDDIDVYELMAFFGNTDQNHKHLLRFGQNNDVTAMFGDPAMMGHPMGVTVTLPATPAATNRMVNLFDYIEVPTRFLGSETFLAIDGSGDARNGGGAFGFEVPFHGVPNFRAPGKININTIYDEDIWDAIFGFPPAAPMDYGTFIANRGARSGPTDFAGVFTSGEGAQFVTGGASGTPMTDIEERASNAGGTIFQLTGSPALPLFDGTSSTTPSKDVVGSPYFRNEFRQRLGSMVTTRSSVFSIWITLGYFELDGSGRIGAELGSLEGQVTRNRAFYIYDRSIPVAFEPGKDHNVDNGILVRTIIQ